MGGYPLDYLGACMSPTIDLCQACRDMPPRVAILRSHIPQYVYDGLIPDEATFSCFFFFFFLLFFWFSFTPHKWIHHQGLGYLFFEKQIN